MDSSPDMMVHMGFDAHPYTPLSLRGVSHSVSPEPLICDMPSTINPAMMMNITPPAQMWEQQVEGLLQSDDFQFQDMLAGTINSPEDAEQAEQAVAPAPAPKKQRKSWGQQLPIPTTNLPPRKRAKTAEEKEQRRVERVLRNRQAAQKSREAKKRMCEAVEKERDYYRNKVTQLENALKVAQQEILILRNRALPPSPPMDAQAISEFGSVHPMPRDSSIAPSEFALNSEDMNGAEYDLSEIKMEQDDFSSVAGLHSFGSAFDSNQSAFANAYLVTHDESLLFNV